MRYQTLNLVGQIYDAVSEPERWSTFLGSLATAVGAHAARMRMLDKQNTCYSVIAAHGHDERFDEQYHAYYTKIDPWNPLLASLPAGQAVIASDYFSEREFKNSEMYTDFWKPHEVVTGLGGNIVKYDGMLARIGFHRAPTQGPYRAEDRQLLQDLMPHLQRAFKLGRHMESLQARAEGMEASLHHATCPLILIDELGQVAFINRRAEELLGDASGLSLRANRLTTLSNAEQGTLQQLLQQAVSTGARRGTGSGGAMRLSGGDGQQRYNLLISPYPNRAVSRLGHTRRICAAVFIHDSRHAGKLSADSLKALYGFTRSEIRLAEAIVEGLTPAEAASRFGVSVNTTRSQLRALFAKTDTQRQAELVKLLLGLSQ